MARWTLAMGLCLCARLALAEPPPAEPPGPSTEPSLYIVLLGTGTPNTDPEAQGPSLAVVVEGRAYLVDCGPGLVRQATAAGREGMHALDSEHLERLFLTHLHSDHTVGFADLLLSPWVMGRDAPLQVYGPPGTAAMAEHIRAAYEADIRVRLEGLEPANDQGHRVEVTEHTGGEIYRDERVAVRAFPARHGAWEHAWGLRFTTPVADICISGDTAPYPEMSVHYRGCDVLVHEVYSAAALEGRDEIWQAYHRASHTSGVDLGRIAAEVQPGLLVLTHQLLWGATPEDLVAEVVGAGFGGQVVYGRDLLWIGVGEDSSSTVRLLDTSADED